ncbi:MAG: DUF4149 domain-containing protein [Gammaproteobacteria bacterium]
MLFTGEQLLKGLWAGCLWTVGYLVAPTLFALLEDRSLAGQLAGAMFTAATVTSLVIAAALAGLYAWLGQGARWRLVLTLSAAALLAANEWGLRPFMEAARLGDGSPGPSFGMLHGISAVLWLAASLATLVLAALPRPASGREG